MQPIKDFNRASELFCKIEWLRIIISALIGFWAIGVWGVVLFPIVVIVLGAWSTKSKLFCTNNYRSGKCENIVSRRKNYCDKCGNNVPDELKK